MSVTPPSISPRLRSRETIVSASRTAPGSGPNAPTLRVMIRLPHIGAAATSAVRFQFAATLFSTLKKKYAAAALTIFVVCMVALLIRGKHGTPAPEDSASEAPRWNSTVTAPASTKEATEPQLQSAARQPRNGEPVPWSSNQQVLTDVRRSAAPDARSGLQAAGGIASPWQANPAPTATADTVPSLSPVYREAFHEDKTAIYPGRNVASPPEPSGPRFTGNINERPPEQSSGDPAGPWNRR